MFKYFRAILFSGDGMVFDIKKNMGGFDRTIRIIAGIILVGSGILKIFPYATIIAIFGVFIILTGIAGFCILYVPLGISTRK